MGVNDPERAFFWDTTTSSWRKAVLGEPGEFVWDTSTNAWVKGTIGAEYLWDQTTQSWLKGPGGDYAWNDTTKSWDKNTTPGGGRYYWDETSKSWLKNAGLDSRILALSGIQPAISADLKSGQAWLRGAPYALTSLPGWGFTRAGVKWAQPVGGDWRSFASGVPAIIPGRGQSIEGVRTSLSKRSRRLDDTSYWTLSNMTTSTSQGVDGVAGSATRLTASGANATALGFANTAGSAACRLAPFVRRIAGTGNIDLTLDGGSTWTTISVTSLFTRLPIGQTLANPRVGVRIVSIGDSIDVDFANGETGAFDSSPIESDTGIVTRPADIPLIDISAYSPAITYPLTMYARFERVVDTGVTETILLATDGTVNNYSGFFVTSGDLARAAMAVGAVTQANPTVAGALAVATSYRVAARFTTNSVQVAKGGVLGTEDTSATTPASPININLGMFPDGTAYSFGYLSEFAIIPGAVSDANLQRLAA